MVDPKYVRIKITDIPEKTTMDKSTLKYNVAAMGYHRLVYWPTTCFLDD
jgi:hypothetical protein